MTGHGQFHLFSLQITLMLAVALVGAALMRKLGQAAVLGELIGGILLGPTVFGAIRPDLYLRIFPEDGAVLSNIDALIKMGMLFFMFTAGLEINLVHFRRHKALIFWTSLLSSLIPFCFGYGLVALFPQLWPQTSQPAALGLFIGVALSISALPVIARILFDLNLINSRIGITIMNSAMINDVVGWSLFALILYGPEQNGSYNGGLRSLAVLAIYSCLLIIIVRRLAHPLLKHFILTWNWPGGSLLVLALLIMASAVGAELAGISVIFGVFVLGIAMGESQIHYSEAEKRIYGALELVALHFFAPLYFVSVGLKINFLDQFDGTLALYVTTVACVSKILGAGLGALIGKLSWLEALAVGIGLNARGAIGIIVASAALEHRLINQKIYVALVFMALVTTVLSAVLLKYLNPSKPASRPLPEVYK